MKRKLFVLLCGILFFSFSVNADEINSEEIINTTTKYYKTIVNNNLYRINNNISTYEISEEEYNNYDSNASTNASVETIYKKLTSTISSSGNYYKYTGKLSWKNIPSQRSYDIIGIGFYSSVKVRNNNLHFSQDYCLSNGNCYTTYTNYPQVFTSGAGTTFLLPSGNLSSLSETIYFEVEKNTNATITSQLAAFDHSHATSSISLTNAKKYTVSGNSGIVLNGVSSYYDAINPAKANWSGNW